MSHASRILLVNPPFPRPTLRGAPLSLLYLAGSLRPPSARFEGECRILDLNINIPADPWQELEPVLGDFKPTHLGITRYSPNAKIAMDLVRQAKRLNPHLIILAGGPHEVFAGDHTRRCLGP